MRLPFLPAPSTRAFMREARRLPGYSLFDWLHGYVYARWPYLYIGIATGEHPLAKRAKPIIAWFDRLLTRKTAQPRRTPPFSERSLELQEAMTDGRRSREPQASAGSQGSVPEQAPTSAVSDGHITFADTYHGKVVTLEAARQLVTVNRDVDLGDLERVIPYALARDIVLKNPDHIVALECPCRVSRPNPCLPLDVCLIVGEPFASFVIEHHPRRSRWITADEATEILAAEHARGHVHHAFFKDAMLGRFYAICNCCDCCCGAMQAHRHGVPMLAASGYVCQADADLCAGCGTCVDVCQFHALALDGGRSVVDFDRCMGCGVCVDACPQAALTLARDERKGIPLEINTLLQHTTV